MPRYSSAVLDALPLAGAEWEAMQVAARAALGMAAQATAWEPLPHQKAPPAGDWDLWLLLAGAARQDRRRRALHRPAREGPALPAGHPRRPPHRDRRADPRRRTEACVNGPSGLRKHNPSVRLVNRIGGTFVIWPIGRGGEAVRGVHARGRRAAPRGRQPLLRLVRGVRGLALHGGVLGPPPVRAPHRPPPAGRGLDDAEAEEAAEALLADPHCAVTRATTDDNPNLPSPTATPGALRRHPARPAGAAGAARGHEGALWTWAMLDDRGRPRRPRRVVVAVDPSGGSDPENDEQGIVGCGLGADGRGYVLADRSCKLSPTAGAGARSSSTSTSRPTRSSARPTSAATWSRPSCGTPRRRWVWPVHYEAVHASRGKAVRAQPVAQLYEQALVSHCDVFPDLEEELTSWTPESGRSPNRLDGWSGPSDEADGQGRARSLRLLSGKGRPMVWDLLVAVVAVALTVAGLVAGAVEILRFRRERRRWERESDEFWRTMERWEPGIRERMERLRGKE
jgi:phage terminase large subunit-like protein